MFRNTSQVNAVWEHFQQQHSAASKPNQQSFNEDIFPEPIFETGSFMRKELVDDYPDDSDRKLQLEYEQERSTFSTYIPKGSLMEIHLH
jgi:hypothetical protein